MKAVLARAAGGPEVLSLIEQAVPQPRDGEVRVRALSIGVNYADVLCRQAVHQSMRPPPIIPGCEAAGIVEACGAGVSRHRIGDRVGVYSPFGGAYAEALVVPENYALPLPESMSLEEGAAFTHVYLTAHEALNASAPPRPGASILVTAAAGGLGGAVLQVAAALELRVIAAVGSSTKRQMLLDRGIQTVIDYGTAHLTEAVLEATDGRGVDIAIETVGGVLFEQAQDALAPLGKIVIAGAASGCEPRPDVSVLLARSATCATLNLSVVFAKQPAQAHAAWERLTALYERKLLQPRIGHRFDLKDAAAAHRLLESRASTDKILLTPPERLSAGQA